MGTKLLLKIRTLPVLGDLHRVLGLGAKSVEHKVPLLLGQLTEGLGKVDAVDPSNLLDQVLMEALAPYQVPGERFCQGTVEHRLIPIRHQEIHVAHRACPESVTISAGTDHSVKGKVPGLHG